jgi:hypothetical protein
MKQLEGVQASEPRLDALVGELTEKLRHHAHDEETEDSRRYLRCVPRRCGARAASSGTWV